MQEIIFTGNIPEHGEMASVSEKKRVNGESIKGIPFFANLSEGEIEDIERMVVKRRFLRGEVVLFEEDTSKFMYFIISGKVKAVLLSSEGKERILAIHKRGDYFGELALFDGKTSPATVIAMEESEIGLLAKRDFDMFVLNNEQILYQLLTSLCMRLRESWMMLRMMSFADAEERVRAVLKNMINRYGVKDQRGMVVPIKLTHRDIANYASVSRETVTRLMSRLSRQGEIELLDRKFLIIKPPFLKKHHSM